MQTLRCVGIARVLGPRAVLFGGLATVTLTLVACGGGGSSPMGANNPPPPPSPSYTASDLVSNRAGVPAGHVDANLVNPWGITFSSQDFVWVANEGTSTSTLYDGNGVTQPPLVAIPAGSSGAAGPTGVVANETTDFVVTSGSASGASAFIFDGLGGTISGWAPAVDMSKAVVAYAGGSAGAEYTGLAIGHDAAGANFLFAADFHNARVDVFDAQFKLVTTDGGFVDSSVPSGYAPFGIQNIPASDGSAQIYVTYAKQDTTARLSVAGAGLGYVAIFDAHGVLLKHLISGGSLNAPWGIALAPANFGPLSGKLLIGNFGDGTVNGFDPASGAAGGTLMHADGTAISIPDLWGIAFGNGVNNQPTTTLFYAAGVNGEADGVYGRIDYGISAPSGGNPSPY